MSDIKPQLIGRAVQALRRHELVDVHEFVENVSAFAAIDVALSAVADDLRAEGAVKELRSAIEELERLDDGTMYSLSIKEAQRALRARAKQIEAGS